MCWCCGSDGVAEGGEAFMVKASGEVALEAVWPEWPAVDESCVCLDQGGPRNDTFPGVVSCLDATGGDEDDPVADSCA